MKKITTKQKTFLIIFVLCLFQLSCRKNNFEKDTIQNDSIILEQFLKLPENASDGLKKIAAKIMAQNEKNNFIPNLVKKNGLPKWDKVLSNQNTTNRTLQETGIYIIPFQEQNNNNISAYLNCIVVDDSINFKFTNKIQLIKKTNLFYNDSVKRTLNIDKLNVFAFLEKQINNKDSLKFNNCFVKSIKNSNVSFISSGRTTTDNFITVPITNCYEVTTGGEGQLLGLEPGNNIDYSQETQTVCHTINVYIWIGSQQSVVSSISANTDWWNDPASQGGGVDFALINNVVTTELGLNPVQSSFLQQNLIFQLQIYNYINIDLYDTSLKKISYEHVYELMNDTAYLNFVNNHINTTSNQSTVWWKDIFWLDNPNNFNSISTSSIKFGNNLMNSMEIETGDYTINDYENTSYLPYDSIPILPTVSPVIPVSKFVGWLYPGVKINCFEYAKKQISKKGYRISGYFDAGQTIQAYKESTGADSNKCKQAIAYLTSALQRGIPVVVGVDEGPGSKNPNTDNTTDHFIVIVGMGNDSNGDYFQFYDNATGNVIKGTSINNKLYIDKTNWIITGQSDAYGPNVPYILTMVRKSKQ